MMEIYFNNFVRIPKFEVISGNYSFQVNMYEYQLKSDDNNVTKHSIISFSYSKNLKDTLQMTNNLNFVYDVKKILKKPINCVIMSRKKFEEINENIIVDEAKEIVLAKIVGVDLKTVLQILNAWKKD